jgi:hypothetical protein
MLHPDLDVAGIQARQRQAQLDALLRERRRLQAQRVAPRLSSVGSGSAVGRRHRPSTMVRASSARNPRPTPSRGFEIDVDRMSYEELLALQEAIGFVKLGVPEHILNSFPKWIPTAADCCCSICLESANGATFRCLPCQHRFHAECVDPWLRENKVCPNCKADVADMGEKMLKRVSAVLQA